MPITPFMGVRISWLIVARNELFAAFAASAASFACCRAADSCFSSVNSWALCRAAPAFAAMVVSRRSDSSVKMPSCVVLCTLITPTVRQYLRDCLDHAVQILDVIDTYHELASNLMDMHLAGVSQRSNDVMKVLTVMASIFIPLTFLAGLYGMNFDYLPELHYRWAYPALLVVMVLVVAGMLLFFRHRGWLGGEEEDDD